MHKTTNAQTSEISKFLRIRVFTYFFTVLPINARGLCKISVRANVADERVEEFIVPVLMNQNLNESCIFLYANHARLS